MQNRLRCIISEKVKPWKAGIIGDELAVELAFCKLNLWIGFGPME